MLVFAQCGSACVLGLCAQVPKFFNALKRTAFGGFELAAARFYAANLVAALEYAWGGGRSLQAPNPQGPQLLALSVPSLSFLLSLYM